MDRSERESVLSLYRRLLEAWNRRSAEEFAAAFAEDGHAVGFDGSPLDGQAEIASTLRGIFAGHPTAAYVAKVREVRELRPGVTLVRAVVGMVPPGRAELNPAVNAVQSVIVLGRGPDARIALLQSTPAAFHSRPELAERLARELTAALQTGQTVTAG